jgi:membrane fusion protein (multidrug efflux system)
LEGAGRFDIGRMLLHFRRSETPAPAGSSPVDRRAGGVHTPQALWKAMKANVACLLLAGWAAAFGCSQQQEKSAQAPPPPEVSVVVIKAQEVPIYLEFVGQVYGHKDIAIRARVEGFLEGIHFEEGSAVEEGRLLYTLESQPFEADVAAKMSGVAEAKIHLAKAASDLARIKPLARRRAVSQSDLDAAVAQHDAAAASVEAAQANLRAAQIQLSYTKVRSPINGIIGKTNAKVGDFVGRSPNPVILNTVSDIETVRVQFFLAENQYLQLARQLIDKGGFESAERPTEAPFELILADGSLYGHRGRFDFIDRQVDPTTGAILVQASFPNPDRLIRPGQFARVRVPAETVKGGILVPQRSVVELQGLYQVYVVDDQNKIEERQVQVGPRLDGRWLVREGLKPGEKIVYEGLQKVADGAVVNPKIVTPPSTPSEKS